MSATEQAVAPAGAAAPEVIRVRVPPRSWRSELRAMKIVWRRELIRFTQRPHPDRHRARPAAALPLRARLGAGAALGGQHRTASS